jgi:hypothetical protein
MALLKFGHAAVVTPVVCPGKWVDKKLPSPGRVITAKDKAVIAKYDPSLWLLSHVSIMASVDVDLADPSDKKSNYLIKPEYSIFVNNNGDCWERELLRKASKTFLGADNYVEHVQIPELSKGKVIDVALRDVPFSKDTDGKELNSLYVDILIATSRKHKDITDKIQSGEYNAVSMGCLIKYSQCSQCGRIMEDESQACKHIRYFKHNSFYDKNGIKRVVAELCGRSEDPDSCKFIDASWVRKPAFEGAVLRNILNMGDTASQDVSDKLQNAVGMPSFEYAPGMYLKAASQAAQSIVNEIEAQDPAPAKDDVGFPEAPADSGKALDVDTPTTDAPTEAPAETPLEAPAEEAPVEETPAEPDSLGDKMGEPGAAPEAAPEPQIEEPKEDATVNEVKDMVKKQLLNQIRRELLKEQATSEGDQRPTDLENASNSSLIKQASLKGVIQASVKMSNDRLTNGLLILSNLKNWNQFKKYGYTRNDVLGLLYFVDKHASTAPVKPDAVKALSKIKLGSSGLVPFFTEIIVETGRSPMKVEAKKIARWAKILSYFE